MNNYTGPGAESSRELTIVFADVAGSVELHERLGDVEAHKCIVDFLASVAAQIGSHNGTVTEIIGDEAMCAFDSADDAFAAAVSIQQTISADSKTPLGVRVGMHTGVAGIDNGHPYGDTVNVAARVAALAKSGQIMLTQDTYTNLSVENKSDAKKFSQTHFKGKFRPTQVYQAVWDRSDSTVLSTKIIAPPTDLRGKPTCLQIRCADTELEIFDGSPELLIGRGDVCGLRVDSDHASRIHATMVFRSGSLVLSDRSTNGTHICVRDGNRASDKQKKFLHHEEHSIVGDCVISLGDPISEQSPYLIHVKFI